MWVDRYIEYKMHKHWKWTKNKDLLATSILMQRDISLWTERRTEWQWKAKNEWREAPQNRNWYNPACSYRCPRIHQRETRIGNCSCSVTIVTGWRGRVGDSDRSSCSGAGEVHLAHWAPWPSCGQWDFEGHLRIERNELPSLDPLYLLTYICCIV